MKQGIYRTLAWSGIQKNKKLYVPYMLTCIGTVMMCYIISFLSTSPTFRNITGGATMQSFLSMGVGVMSVFSLIFLFYSNSFLIRRRKKEFGLYNILGVGKKHLALVLFLETLIIATITIVAGLFFGILFSKLAELCMIKILDGTATFALTLSFPSIYQTALLFVIIFAFIYLNTLRQIHLTNPIQLLRSENAGEKPPKANWIIAILGAVLLAVAYYWAVTIEDPVTALMMFFVAVVMVVVATYLLFIAGSVVICKVLQKNKNYYYKTNHFVSVSSMVYRMKRNGAGLASICVLCTMVLVMVSSTVCLYIGAEDSLRNRFPRNINLDAIASSAEMLEGQQVQQVKQLVQQITEENNTQQENILEFRTAAMGGILHGNEMLVDESAYGNRMNAMSDIWQIFIVPLEDYNHLMGKQETLSSGEVMIYTTKEVDYTFDTIKLQDMTFRVKKQAEGFVDNGVDSMQIFPTMYLFVPNFTEIVEPFQGLTTNTGRNLLSFHWCYAFDLPCDDTTQIEILRQIETKISLQLDNPQETSYFSISTEGVAQERTDFYAIYGGLFFLGILLGIVFIFAAVLIIYYKQVSEGYEDQSRFDIMQKVGMTKKEIKQSINSQILTVFFTPLLMAGVHLAFAFPLIRKLLMLLGLMDTQLLIITTLCCYAVFGVFYGVIYKVTSQSYFSIVSKIKE